MAAKRIGYFGPHDYRSVYDMGDGTFRWTHESETNGLGYPIWVESTSLPDNFMPDRGEETPEEPDHDPVNGPRYYLFPGGVQLKSITTHLTGNGAQAVQYITRSTRLDGNNKGELVEDLRKAAYFVQQEIERLEGR
ncbi:hypothetical protein [Nocardia nova]|uniref:hypothetical protein n=1 Tax=Nocardia nova TaxID=37330 RepID=UPI0027399E73|nr:hypothetical protein [Nocardia nova]